MKIVEERKRERSIRSVLRKILARSLADRRDPQYRPSFKGFHRSQAHVSEVQRRRLML